MPSKFVADFLDCPVNFYVSIYNRSRHQKSPHLLQSYPDRFRCIEEAFRLADNPSDLPPGGPDWLQNFAPATRHFCAAVVLFFYLSTIPILGIPPPFQIVTILNAETLEVGGR